MTKEDIIRKLTSRKFWLAIIGFVTPLMVALGASEGEISQASAIIMGGGVLIAYIVGEGLVDASREGGSGDIVYLPEPTQEKTEEE